MTARRAVLALALAAPAALSGCGEPPPVQTRFVVAEHGISRYVDHEAGVVCWVYAGYNKGGISCLPCSEVAGNACAGGEAP